MASQLKLRVGGVYLTRDGRIAIIENYLWYESHYPYIGTLDGCKESWYENGSWYLQPGEIYEKGVEPDGADLILELNSA